MPLVLRLEVNGSHRSCTLLQQSSGEVTADKSACSADDYFLLTYAQKLVTRNAV
jgi:hypothetical protein